MLKKEKDGSLFKDTKLASVYAACRDELRKIATEGSPIGELFNEGKPEMEQGQNVPGKRKDKGQFPSNPASMPVHDPPAPPEDSEPPQVYDGMSKIQHAMADEFLKISQGTSHSEAVESLSKLRRLEREKPTGGELARNALAGVAVMPAVTTASSLVAGEQPIQKALEARRLTGVGTIGSALKRGAWKSGRGLAGAALSGAVLGAGLPLARGYLHREAEKETLRDYLGVSKRGKTRKKVKKELGV